LPFNCCGTCACSDNKTSFGSCCFNPYQTIQRGYKGIITRFGSVKKIISDGLHYINPITENLTIVDTMIHVKKLAKQTILTKDKLPITIDGCVYYKINNQNKDIVNAYFGVTNITMAVDELAHASLRSVFGNHTLQEGLEKRKEFALDIKNVVGIQAKNWGIIIHDIQIIDITIPDHIQKLLATGATAEQEAKAQIVMAEASVKSAELMKNAADLLNTPAAMQIRTLETYKILAESDNSKLIFLPAPSNNTDMFINTAASNLIATQISSSKSH